MTSISQQANNASTRGRSRHDAADETNLEHEQPNFVGLRELRSRRASATRIDGSMERRTSVLHRRRGGRERRSQPVMATFAEDEDVAPDPAASLSAAGVPDEPSGSRVWSSSCGGYRMRLPTPNVETTTVVSSLNIDLKLPRLPNAKLSPRQRREEAGSRSAFVMEANNRLQSKLDLLNTQIGSPRAETQISRDDEPVNRASILRAVNRLGLAGMLGTNEEHAIEFKKGLGEVTGLISARCAPPEAGGSGLWDAPTTTLAVQPQTQKPIGKSPRQRTEERREEMKLQLEVYRASRSKIQLEVEERIERVRNDERFALAFENNVAKIVQDRLIAQNNRYGEKDHVQLNVDGVWEMHSPRGLEERLQLRTEQQKERRAAARERFRAVMDRKEQEQVGDRRMLLRAKRVETEARNRQMLLQSHWLMLLALAARASALGRRIDSERTRRKEYVAVLRVQLRIKLYVMHKREKMIVRRKHAPSHPTQP